MTLLDFPDSPTIGQTYSFGARTWEWTGDVWKLLTAGGGGDSAQVGEMRWFAGDAEPDEKWLACDGAVYDQAAYPELFTEIGLLPNVQAGENWTPREVTGVDGLYFVAYGNGTWVATYFDGTNQIASSTDNGATWTVRNKPSGVGDLGGVAFGDGQFVAVAFNGTDRVITSSDGVTWTAQTAAEQNIWQSVAYGDGLWVAVSADGTNRVMTSPDAVTWTARSAAEQNLWTSVQYGDGLWVAVATTGTNRIMTSPNGVDWIARESPPEFKGFSVAYGDGLWVSVGGSSLGRNIITSSDGVWWTSRVEVGNNDGFAVVENWESVAYGGGTWVATSSNNFVAISKDGKIWDIRKIPEDNFWGGVAYGDGSWVVVGEPVATSNFAATSTGFEYDVATEFTVPRQLQYPTLGDRSTLWIRAEP
jgi:hypothetical protein